jgi:peptidoglycan/xylan/chitin deacetylase (PgdA/CDA1 family)
MSRIFSVIFQFGISPKKFERHLQKYAEIMESANCRQTLAITAVVLKRHPDYIKELSWQGVEFAIHGYVHIDYQVVAEEKRRKHFQKAIDVFNGCQIPFVGFRPPFLRSPENTIPILRDLGFLYNSSRALWWPVRDIEKYPVYQRNNLQQLLNFYKPLGSDKYLSLPRVNEGLIDIPVSIPDDEVLVERLGITDRTKISDIWWDIMEKIYNRGELFVLSLHPERIEYCETGLRELLRKVKGYNPPIWVATLKEIAEWWQEKDKFVFNIQPQCNGKYEVRAECSERATVLIKNGKVNVPSDRWFGGYQCVSSRNFILESPVRPVIGVKPDSSMAAIMFLHSEGYILEPSEEPGDCGLYLGYLQRFGKADEMALVKQIEQSNASLLRYWRWPDRARSALSVTGDIDSITLMDFVLRVLEGKLPS